MIEEVVNLIAAFIQTFFILLSVCFGHPLLKFQLIVLLVELLQINKNQKI